VVEPGRRCLGDRYELHQLIAAGGMGQVWRGLDIALHRPVAVKVLRSEYTGDPTFVARFRAEAQHAASMSHPNIAAVFDYGEEIAQDGTGETLAYLVMELVEGEPLSALLAREGALGTETTLSLLRQTAFGLGEAHRAGMVHRDVKPGNILVRPDGSVKITDFGIAWSARSVALTRTGQVIGTPQYLSPEQAEGRPATPASDVYALGLIGYECLVGRPAFEGDNPVTIALKQVRQDPEPLPAHLPADVRELIGRALVKDADARYPDGCTFVDAIDDILAGRPLDRSTATVGVAAAVPPPRPALVDTQAVGPVTRPPTDRRRSKVAMILLPLLGLLAGAGIAVALLQALTDPSSGAPANAAEQRDSGTIVIDADDYVGDPVGEVAERLTALGLDVELKAERRDDAPADRVTGIDPAGEPLRPGDTVVVTYAVGSTAVDGGTGGQQRAVVTDAGGDGAGVTESGAAQPTDGAVGGGEPVGDAGSGGAQPTGGEDPQGGTGEPTETTTPTEPTTSETPPPSSPTTSTETSAATSTSVATDG
jgi:serine/threonine-protein kinase